MRTAPFRSLGRVGQLVGLLVVALPRAAQADDADLALDLGNDVVLELRRIPRGSFTEGSTPSEPGRDADEAPRQVTITHELWMGKTEVARAQFARFVAETRYVTEAENGQSGGAGWDGTHLVQKKEFSWRSPGFPQTEADPVVLVTWGDANAFTAWASRKTGRSVRLPTEAEWEYAARGGTTTPWYAGRTEEDALSSGWFKSNAGAGTHPVAQKKPNAFGLFDVEGNVYEWCRDVYAPYGGAAPAASSSSSAPPPLKPATDPENANHTATDTLRRVLRGGAWTKETKKARSAARYRNAPGSRNADNGFRVAVTVDDAIAPGVGLGGGLPASAPPVDLTQPTKNASPAPGASSFSLVPIIGAPIVFVAAILAWILGRRKRNAPDAQGYATRAVADGFWLDAPARPPGTRIRYECVVGGYPVSDVVPLDGVATFIYTGGQPLGIRVLETIVAQGGGYRAPEGAARRGPPTVAPPPTEEPTTTFLGDPRAY